jgi:hypothetical protein
VAVAIAGEGPLDLAILRRLLGDAGLVADHEIWGGWGRGGKNGMEPRLPQWAAGAALGHVVVVLRDLDDDAPCAPMLRERLMPEMPPTMLLRIAVHAAEAWLIADRYRLARWLDTDPGLLPEDPEAAPRPKDIVIAAAEASRSALVRAGVPPGSGGRRQGPDYNPTLIGFVHGPWQPVLAARHSPSLHRTLAAIETLRIHVARSV